jgi:glycosyltransferase involved in cell wall biosynthesis
MRLLMVSPNYLPVIGGVETHMSQVAPRLIEAGLEVEILTTDRTGVLPEHDLVNGVPVTRVRAYPESRDYCMAPEVFRAVSEGGWDLVHCQGYHTFVPPLAMLGALRARMPFVLTFHSGGHSSRLRNELRAVQTLALRPLLRQARRLIAVSEFESELFRRRLRLARRCFEVIPNGVDPLFFAPTAAGPAAGPLIVSAGRLEWYKGHDRAIRALPYLLAGRPGIRLRIAGAGPCEAMLRDLARNLGVGDRVEVAPVAGGDVRAMHDLLASASVVVQLSEYEAGPLAAIEAAATGRPVLVSDTSGLAELARHGWASAISPSAGPAEIARCIDRLIDQGPLEAPRDLPTWDATAAALLRLYETVLGRAEWPPAGSR